LITKVVGEHNHLIKHIVNSQFITVENSFHKSAQNQTKIERNLTKNEQQVKTN
jgi:hypothetical protein